MAENSNAHVDYNTPPYQQPQDSKRLVCGILAILLGGLVIKYFFRGKTTGGILTILISICTCGIWSIVMLVQGILILCMSDQEFKRKYIDSTSTLPLF